MNASDQTPFSLLPEALVEEMLTKSQDVGRALLNNVNEVNENKLEYRRQLDAEGLLKHISDLPHTAAPTTVGIDGSHVVERLLATDLVSCAAVGIEGLTPPSEERYWEKPNHMVYINPHPHHPDTGTVIRGIMWELEIMLAALPPHDVIFLDGSIVNPFLNLNAALAKVRDFIGSDLAKELVSKFPDFLSAYHTITTSNRSDKIWVGIPKYTSKREIGFSLKWPAQYDDRSILTSILKSGEYTHPVPYDQPLEEWHIGMSNLKHIDPRMEEKLPEFEKKLDEIKSGIYELHVCYYRPHTYTPALRIEVPKSLTSNKYQMSMLLNAISFQCGTPGIIEPYPLYMADRMVKSIGTAIPAFRQTATMEMAQVSGDDLSDVFFNMHSYRTEL